jgi:transcription elongation factor GreA
MSTGDMKVNPSLSEAAGIYLTKLKYDKRTPAQQEINKFIRWCGWERSFSDLEGSSVGKYAEGLSQTDADCVRKLEMIRGFLTYAHKEHWSKENLSVSVRIVSKGKPKSSSVKKKARKQEPVYMSQDALDKVEIELRELKDKRGAVIEDIRRAAADKDFRENAPYHAAREQKSMIDGKIMELEEMVASVAIIDGQRNHTHKVTIGDTVVLQDSDSGKEVCFTFVGPREVDPSNGKISAVSPIGKAVIGRTVDDTIEVMVPSGKLHYILKKIEH